MIPKQLHYNSNSKKRNASGQENDSGRARKRVKTQDARIIATQTSGKAFGNGEIDVDKFVKARAFEIQAIEDSMRRSRKTLSNRAFQNVPRDLRRRTASHDVKRVPKKLRARATREMVEDNTPTVNSKTRKKSPKDRLRMDTVKRLRILSKHLDSTKRPGPARNGSSGTGEGHAKLNKTNEPPEKVKSEVHAEAQIKFRSPRVKRNVLQKPPKPKAKFRKRQIHKTWLPTHLFHAKRAHMTPPTEPLWRIAIPLSPTEKSYRPIHRASRERGAVAWDTSYMATIGLEGTRKSMISLLRAMGVGASDKAGFWQTSQRWERGTRSWSGWLFEHNQWPSKCIAPVSIMWCACNIDDVVIAGERLIQTSKESKVKRKAFVRVHPSAFLSLWNEFLKVSKIQQPRVMVEDLRFEVGSIEITGPAATEALAGALWPSISTGNSEQSDSISNDTWKSLSLLTNPASLPSNILIPLTVSDPRLHHPPRKMQNNFGEKEQFQLLQTLSEWPLDKNPSPSALFDRSARLEASRRLPSQKSINRRKAAANPGTYPEQKPTDPRIPVIVLAAPRIAGKLGSWILMLPWKCVNPVWYSIIYHPLSSGGTVRFGGLDQTRQIAFEAGQPWFPGDYPGTAAGRAWEAIEREARRKEWQRRPKGKRIEWESLKLGKDCKGEIGDGWACHWEQLLKAHLGNGSEEPSITHLLAPLALDRLKHPETFMDARDLKDALTTVSLTMLKRGVPSVCARIYRIPTANTELRRKWLSLVTKKTPRAQRVMALVKPPKDAPAHVQRQYLAALLVRPPSEGNMEIGNEHYPQCPGEEDLVGFVTTGNFNLGEGKGTAIGCLLLQKILDRPKNEATHDIKDLPKTKRLCIIRDAGHEFGRLARWELR